jgi:hypothetical protein
MHRARLTLSSCAFINFHRSPSATLSFQHSSATTPLLCLTSITTSGTSPLPFTGFLARWWSRTFRSSDVALSTLSRKKSRKTHGLVLLHWGRSPSYVPRKHLVRRGTLTTVPSAPPDRQLGHASLASFRSANLHNRRRDPHCLESRRVMEP